ncbi:MAG TPA: acireductone dioxygenase [Leptospiraceae bacterium]|nr:acireductone dioxygenase [Leptospiraceae bacterium]HMW03963.1 acireductone dioxygenase [Leptospiraceae bacterium]HMX33601.1 acireductone dioxygenase [Leptospiraceae bacterium]HMY29943.1 acireductone dioxygenase [Leptospiraceae bacterium]HMZ66780.1 acireductone dioxygenase [Leptospiraceae bacterium]
MAKIIRKNKPEITDKGEVKKFLHDHGVEYDHWVVPDSAKIFTSKQVLSDSEKENLLLTVNDRFEYLKNKEGYTTRDLVVLHPEVPGIHDMLAKFDKVHTHSDVEVRYIIDGSGYFGFVAKEGNFLVHVFESDFISVPKGTQHWFTLDDKLRIKAVRYFKDTSGWVPNYVEGAVASIG